MDPKLHLKHNKAMIFRPKTTPRMLPGQVEMTQLRKDTIIYNQHLYRLFTATHRIDCKPPYLPPYTYVDVKKLKIDSDRVEEIDRENKKLLTRINSINRSPAAVCCWNTYTTTPGLAGVAFNARSQKYMAENKRLLECIKNASSLYSRKIMKEHWKYSGHMFEESIHLEKVLHIKKPLDKQLEEKPSISGGLMPDIVFPKRKAYMDFSIKNGVRLGQIVVELYQGHEPKMVRNFLAHCYESAEYSYKNCRIHAGSKGKYFATGDVIMQNGKCGHTIFPDNCMFRSCDCNNGLRHTRAGLLVGVPIYERDKFDASLTIAQRVRRTPPPPTYNSQFAITLCARDWYAGRGPIFGKIVRGNAVLAKIDDMLKKCGTPLADIVISRCGEIPLSAEEADQLQYAEELAAEEGSECCDDNYDGSLQF